MVGEIWDYLMRRKVLLALLLLTLALGGILGAKTMASHKTIIGQSQEINVNSTATYNNSLILQIPGQSGKIAYQMTFVDGFTAAQIKVNSEPLAAAAHVRVYDTAGMLVVDDRTDETHQFSNVAVNRKITLFPGYIIEIEANNLQVMSTLTYSPANEFAPRNTTESYMVTSKGLRKLAWSAPEGEQAMYNLLKKYLTGQIEAYKAQISEEVLNNKNLDTAKKTQIIAAYNTLKPSDQSIYYEFISRLRRGGVPQITYHGERSYKAGENVDFMNLVSVRDGEDGEYTPDQVAITSTVDLSQPGEYTLAYTASDSDRNTVTLKIPITVVTTESQSTNVTPKQPDPVTNTAQSITHNAPTIGGGINIDGGSIDQATDETIRDEQTTANDIFDPTNISVASSDDEKAEKPTPSAGINASQIVLMVLGVVLLFGLVRFIFDHYVR